MPASFVSGSGSQRDFEFFIESAGDLRVVRFRLEEAVAELGYLSIHFATTNLGIAQNSLIDQPAALRIQCGSSNSEQYRFYYGFVRQVAVVGGNDEFIQLRAIVVPRFWRLGLCQRSRVHVTDRSQGRSIREVIERILKDAGFSGEDYAFRFASTYEKYTFLAQYRESDLAFISRLCENEGITYFIDHSEERDTVVFCDSNEQCKKAEPFANVLVEPGMGAMGDEHERIDTFDHAMSVHHDAVHIGDYDFKDADRTAQGTEKRGSKGYEFYDYPGGFQDQESASLRMNRLAKVRQQEFASGQTRIHGSGNYRSIAPGRTFKTDGPARSDIQGNWLCLSVIHEGSENFQGFSERTYINSFQCLPADLPFRPPRRTPRPFVHGTQTAIVVGPAGEEIYCDSYGRVKVRFYWDRESPGDENSSYWVRVAQVHAGPSFGGIDIPRIGEEVIIDFLEGDPNQPIILGRVYNSSKKVPFPLPAEKTRSGMKSQTVFGEGYNEITLDDTQGAELIRIHGQFDMDSTIEHDQREVVGNDRTRTVGRDENITIGNNRTESVGKDESITIGQNRTESVGKDESITIGKNRSESVGENESITIGKNWSANVAKVITIQAGDQILLKTGAASILMKKDGSIKIDGKDIVINGSGKITLKASGDMVLKGSKIGEN